MKDKEFEYPVSQLRRDILNLQNEDERLPFIEIIDGLKIVFKRFDYKILIYNKEKESKNSMHIDRKNLLNGRNEIESNLLFAQFLKNIVSNGDIDLIK